MHVKIICKLENYYFYYNNRVKIILQKKICVAEIQEINFSVSEKLQIFCILIFLLYIYLKRHDGKKISEITYKSIIRMNENIFSGKKEM